MFGGLFQNEALLFTIPAMLGTLVFVIRLGLMLIGGIGDGVDGGHMDLGGHMDVGADVDMDVDTDVHLGADADGGDSTHAFELLSLQSIAAFLMGFGWGGLGGFIGFDWTVPTSVLAGVAFGAALVWLLGLLMKAMYDLQASGNVHIQDAVGAQGTVYANVPARGGGRGQVRVVVNQQARIYNAVSDGDAIVTSSSVRVVRANEDHTLTVTPV